MTSKKKFEPIFIRVDESESKRLRFDRGKRDAELGFPPSDPSIEYQEGYQEGRRPGNSCNWKG